MKKDSKFKKTEIGKAISINPKRDLKKETIAKKVSMDKLNPFTKKIKGFEVTEFKGGSKFVNGDTLLARITPCLENGKTAYVDFLDEGEVGFGSTEFIVLFEKEGETINEFVYYLAISPIFRHQAISSMTGTSGRQRVQTNFLEIKEIEIPPLPEQSAIAHILSTLDEKIELLQKQNKTLEEIGQAIFKKWFIDNSEKEGWEEGKLGDFVECVSGCSYTSKGLESSDKALVTLKSVGVEGFKQEGFKEYTEEYREKQVVEEGDIVVAHTDLTQNQIILGKPVIVRDFGKYKKMIASMDLSIIRPIKLINKPFLYYLLSTNSFHGHAQGYANGTTVIHLSRKAVPEFEFKMPNKELLKEFNTLSEKLFGRIKINDLQIQTLSQIRDSLLPKLMSGKIRVLIK
ncbi:MAG: restriction endonuclease subunit S [Nanoarchaeota archaeon]|nr:restriction endonuclease subunit S [Nanoarchaeota archaeon]